MNNWYLNSLNNNQKKNNMKSTKNKENQSRISKIQNKKYTGKRIRFKDIKTWFNLKNKILSYKKERKMNKLVKFKGFKECYKILKL